MDKKTKQKADRLKDIISQSHSAEERQEKITRSLIYDVEKNDYELATLIKKAAIPRQLNDSIICILDAKKRTDSENRELLKRISKFPFISSDIEKKKYFMHEMTQDLLIQDWQNPENRNEYKKINIRLWEYYAASESKNDKIEGVYHRFVFDSDSAFKEFKLMFNKADDLDHRTECHSLLLAAEQQKRELNGDQIMWLRYYKAGYNRVLDHWDTAQEMYLSLLSEKELLSPLLYVWTLHSLGRTYYYRGIYSEAEKTFLAALNKWEVVPKDTSGKWMTLNSLGLVYEGMGQWKKAKEVYSLSIEICKKNNDRHHLGWVLNNLGHVYHCQGSFKKAKEYYDKSMEIKNDIGDKRGQWWTFNNMGVLSIDIGNWEDSLNYLDKAIKICKELDDPIGSSKVLGNIGKYYKRLGHYENAEKCYLQSLSLQKKNKGWYLAGKTLIVLSEIYSLKGDWEKSSFYAEEASKCLIMTEKNVYP